MKKYLILLLPVFILTLSHASENPIAELQNRVVEHTLKNGMKLLILERHTAPLVSYQMMFRAGGVDDKAGQTGIAHLFEHMMFKGSQTVGAKDYAKEKPLLEKLDRLAQEIITEESKAPNTDPSRLKSLQNQMTRLEKEHQSLIIPAEFDQIYQREGGEGLNAFTGKDMTGFVISLPSNKWELWPILESDRMARPVLREFYKERDVVMEERRMRYDSAPNGKIWEEFLAAAYKAHPYGMPTIGWPSDLRRLTAPIAKEFFKKHYAPNNAVVAIVGDVQSAQVIEKIENYFSKISSQPLVTDYPTDEPVQNGERRVIVRFDAEPSMLMGFHKPPPPHPDNSAMDMIEQLLNRGRTSRFYQNIVEKQTAIEAFASNGNPGERYPNMIIFGGDPGTPKKNPAREK
ncbi:MAG: pitrilysin family protein, partial [Bdellovibrionota bacterium]